jgi:nucleoside-diphosphate-sugar epimerase
MQVLVAGAGYTGRRVISRLGDLPVIALRSSDIDLDHPGEQRIDVPPDCRILYTVPPNARKPGDPRLAAFLDRLSAAPERIVYLSTTGVYGNRDGDRVTEETPPAPGTARAERRMAAEQLLATWCEQHGTKCYVLRVPGIYGPDRLGLDRLRAGTPVITEAEASPGNRIHVEDLAVCAVQALTTAETPGIYNVGDGDHRSSGAFAALVADIAGLPAPPALPRAEVESTMSEMQRSFANESRIVDTTKMREVLGFIPTYSDPADGIRASLSDTG